jgi:hypothetical protein
VNGPIRTIALICGVLLVIASIFTISAALRGGKPHAPGAVIARATAPPTAAPSASPAPPTAAPTASPAPRATATPDRRPTPAPTTPTPTPTPRASYAPLRPVQVRAFPSSPPPTPARTPSPPPQSTPSPAPRTPAATPRATGTATASAGPLVGGPDDDACLRTLTYLKTAADERLSRREIYNAAEAGLAMNAHCSEPRRGVNEAYLLAMRAPAAFALRTGDWNADLNRSDALLELCIANPDFRATTVAGDCATQRKFNDLVRRRILQLLARRPSQAPR